jgi:hypothetical protein
VLLAAGLLALGCVFNACLDLTPIGESPVVGDGGLPVARDASGADGGSCEPCFFSEADTGESCKETMDKCNATAPCAKIVRCMLDVGCYDGLGGEAANRCGLNCVLGAGVTSPVDPGLAAAVDMADCSHRKCPVLCFKDPPDGAM